VEESRFRRRVHDDADRTYETSAGPCRDFTVDAKIDGKPEKVQGSACRQPNGTWKTTG
jgi:surface antigen